MQIVTLTKHVIQRPDGANTLQFSSSNIKHSSCAYVSLCRFNVHYTLACRGLCGRKTVSVKDPSKKLHGITVRELFRVNKIQLILAHGRPRVCVYARILFFFSNRETESETSSFIDNILQHGNSYKRTENGFEFENENR